MSSVTFSTALKIVGESKSFSPAMISSSSEPVAATPIGVGRGETAESRWARRRGAGAAIACGVVGAGTAVVGAGGARW